MDQICSSQSLKPEILPLCEEGLGKVCANCHIGEALKTNKIWQDFLRERIRHQYKAGSTIFGQGSVVGFVFLLFDGLVKISMGDGSGRNRLLAVISSQHAPCTILDPSALDRSVHSYTCETLTDCSVYCLPKPVFLWCMREEFNLAKLALSAVSHDLEMFLNRAKQELDTSGRERLAQLLLSLLHLQGESHGPPNKITIPLTRQELSSMIGVTRETLSRLLRTFAHSKIISLTEDGIIIQKPEQLKKIVGNS